MRHRRLIGSKTRTKMSPGKKGGTVLLPEPPYFWLLCCNLPSLWNPDVCSLWSRFFLLCTCRGTRVSWPYHAPLFYGACTPCTAHLSLAMQGACGGGEPACRLMALLSWCISYSISINVEKKAKRNERTTYRKRVASRLESRCTETRTDLPRYVCRARRLRRRHSPVSDQEDLRFFSPWSDYERRGREGGWLRCWMLILIYMDPYI